MAEKKDVDKCLFCNKDCTKVKHSEGVCLRCAELYKSIGVDKLIEELACYALSVKNVISNSEKLVKELKELRKELWVLKRHEYVPYRNRGYIKKEK